MKVEAEVKDVLVLNLSLRRLDEAHLGKIVNLVQRKYPGTAISFRDVDSHLRLREEIAPQVEELIKACDLNPKERRPIVLVPPTLAPLTGVLVLGMAKVVSPEIGIVFFRRQANSAATTSTGPVWRQAGGQRDMGQGGADDDDIPPATTPATAPATIPEPYSVQRTYDEGYSSERGGYAYGRGRSDDDSCVPGMRCYEPKQKGQGKKANVQSWKGHVVTQIVWVPTS